MSTRRLSNRTRIIIFVVLLIVAVAALWYLNYTTAPASNLLKSAEQTISSP